MPLSLVASSLFGNNRRLLSNNALKSLLFPANRRRVLAVLLLRIALHEAPGRGVNPVRYCSAQFARRLADGDAFAVELSARTTMGEGSRR